MVFSENRRNCFFYIVNVFVRRRHDTMLQSSTKLTVCDYFLNIFLGVQKAVFVALEQLPSLFILQYGTAKYNCLLGSPPVKSDS